MWHWEDLGREDLFSRVKDDLIKRADLESSKYGSTDYINPGKETQGQWFRSNGLCSLNRSLRSYYQNGEWIVESYGSQNQ